MSDRQPARAGALAASPPRPLQTLTERFDREAFEPQGGRARVRLAVLGKGTWDAVLDGATARLVPVKGDADATLTADARVWRTIAEDVRGGMDAYRRGRLSVRRNLHVGVGFLAATSGLSGPGRLRFRMISTRRGALSSIEAGSGPPLVAIHGLGATKGSFLPTVAALSDRYRVIAVDLPGFGDSEKPIGASYDARFFARAVVALLDALELDRAHLIGNSLGGRVALEVGLASSRQGRPPGSAVPVACVATGASVGATGQAHAAEARTGSDRPAAARRGDRAPSHPGRRGRLERSRRR